MSIQNLTLMAWKNHCDYSKMYYMYPFQNMSQESNRFLWTQYGQSSNPTGMQYDLEFSSSKA
jgi:hypothetical protein